MQIVFKTSYDQDIDLLTKTGEYLRVSFVILMMLAAPLYLDVYYLGELGLLLVYVIAGIGLMILTGLVQLKSGWRNSSTRSFFAACDVSQPLCQK